MTHIKETPLEDIEDNKKGSPAPTSSATDKKAPAPPDMQVKAKQSSPRRKFSATYKLKILEDYDACESSLARGALLRREALYSAAISTWRKQRDGGRLGQENQKTSPLSCCLFHALETTLHEHAQKPSQLYRRFLVSHLPKKTFSYVNLIRESCWDVGHTQELIKIAYVVCIKPKLLER